MSKEHILVVSVFVAATTLIVQPVRGQDVSADVSGLRHRVDRLEAQLAGLQDDVSKLEDPTKPIFVTVDCGAGQTVGNALAQAQGKAGPLYITIVGTCDEAVLISRDNVTLMGAAPGAGIHAPSPSDNALSLDGVRRIGLHQLEIDAGNGRAGISAGHGSSFTAIGTTVRGGSIWGVKIDHGSSGYFHGCTIADGPSFGIAVSGAAELHNCEVRRHSLGVYAENGGNILVYQSTVRENGTGVFAFVHGTVKLAGSVIEANRQAGVSAILNSTIEIRDKSRIADNLGPGATAHASALNIEETVIENNMGPGVDLFSGSAAGVADDVTIRGNGGDGIRLQDLSNGSGGYLRSDVGPVSISANSGWGINCAGPSAVTLAQNGFELVNILFSGNTSGSTNCPVR